MLQTLFHVLREGQKLRVFNAILLRKLGANIHDELGRLLKLHKSYVTSLNRMSYIDISTLKGTV